MGFRLGTSLSAVALMAASVAFAQSNVATPVLVELFTSEGCSSCPPADALLRKLDGLKTDRGQVIVALSEHVTYWNQLGWADPFSSEIFTQRQNNYGDRFHLDSVYTPQVVVNGDREVLGSDGNAVLKAVQAQSGMSKDRLKIVSVMPDHETLVVTYEASGPMSDHRVHLYAALADDMDSSEVSRGENAGHVLQHVAVVRSLVTMDTLQVGGPITVRLPAAARGPRRPGAPMHLVLFAQDAGQGKVLAVAMKALPQQGATDNAGIAAVH